MDSIGVARKNQTYRYYRVAFPADLWADRMYRNKNLYEGSTCALYAIHLYDLSDNNVMDYAKVSSNVYKPSSLDSWISDVRNNIPHSLWVLPACLSYIEIDCKEPTKVYKVAVSMKNPIHGFCLLGSYDSENWEVLLECPPWILYDDYPWLVSEDKWYSYIVDDVTRQNSTLGYRYWGFVIGVSHQMQTQVVGYHESWCNVAVLDFLDSSSNSLVPNGVGEVLHSSFTENPHGLWNATYSGVYKQTYPGYMFSYDFGKAVYPSNAVLGLVGRVGDPLEVFVMKSPDSRTWFTHKILDTPYGTWDNGSYTEKVFQI